MITKTKAAAFLIFLFQLLSLNSAMAVEFASCPDGFRTLRDPPLSSSVELEMDNSPAVLNILTTKTGKVGILFEEIGVTKAPTYLLKNFNDGMTFQKLKDLNWDNLTNTQKYAVLDFVSENKKTDFFTDRKFPGLRVRKKVKMNFPKGTRFLGTDYAPGVHEVNLEKEMGLVEYSGPEQSAEKLELHFRTKIQSGAASKQARIFQTAIGAPATHQHVHIVAKIPIEKLNASPLLQSTRMGEYYRRVNLVAEMQSIMTGSSIIKNSTRKAVYFDNLSTENLHGVTQYFEDLAANKKVKIGDKYKMAWVGFRGSDKYDEPGLFGFEVRSISAKSNSSENLMFLDSIQHAMTKDEYGIPPEKISDWLKIYHEGESAADAVNSSWYNKPFKQLYIDSDPKIKNIIGIRGKLNFWINSEKKESKLLLYNWSKDPLLFDKPELLEKILNLQIEAVKKVQSGANPSLTTRNFIKETGLYEIFAKSIGG